MIERGPDKSYLATLTVTLGEDSHEMDARPSDALNIAARTAGRVFVEADLMDECAISSTGELDSRLTEDLAAIPDADAELPGEWRSLTSDLMTSLASSGGS